MRAAWLITSVLMCALGCRPAPPVATKPTEAVRSPDGPAPPPTKPPPVFGLARGLACVVADSRAECAGFLGGARDEPAHKGRVAFAQPGIVDIDADSHHICAVGEGELRCWERKYHPPDGKGPAPVLTARVEGAQQVEVGLGVACTRSDGGRLECHAFGGHTPSGRVVLDEDAVDVSVDVLTTCWASRGGSVRCATPDEYDSEKDPPDAAEIVGEPKVRENLRDVVQVGVGFNYKCARHRAGTVSCWGSGYEGRLGDGNPSFDDRGPVAVLGLDDAVSLEVGLDNACVVRSEGSVWCWGRNDQGLLGAAAPRVPNVAVLVPEVTDAVAVAVTESLACATLRDASIECWGRDRAIYDRPKEKPEPIVARDSRRILIGVDFLCSQDSADSMQCLGNPNFDRTPYQQGEWWTAPFPPAQMIHDRCAWLVDGRIVCWPGDPFDDENGTTLLEDVVAFSEWGSSSCAVLAEGSVKCWSMRRSSTLELVPVRSYRDARDVAVFRDTVCVLRRNGRGECTEYLGPGAVARAKATPLRGLRDGTALEVRRGQLCATRADESVICWAADALDGRPTPAELPLRQVRHISLRHSAGVGVDAQGTPQFFMVEAKGSPPKLVEAGRLHGGSPVVQVESVGNTICTRDDRGVVRCINHQRLLRPTDLVWPPEKLPLTADLAARQRG